MSRVYTHLREAYVHLRLAKDTLDAAPEAEELAASVGGLLAEVEATAGRLALRDATAAPARKPRKTRQAKARAEEQEEAPAEPADGLCPGEGCSRPARRGGKPCKRCYQREWKRRREEA